MKLQLAADVQEEVDDHARSLGLSAQDIIRIAVAQYLGRTPGVPKGPSVHTKGDETAPAGAPKAPEVTVEKEGTFKEGDRAENASASSPLGRKGEVVASASSPSLPSILPTTVDNSPVQDSRRVPDADGLGVDMPAGEVDRVSGGRRELQPGDSAGEGPSHESTVTSPRGAGVSAPGPYGRDEIGPGQLGPDDPSQRVEAPHFHDDTGSVAERTRRFSEGSRPDGPTADVPGFESRQTPPVFGPPPPEESPLPRPAAKSRGPRPTIGPRFEAFWAVWPSGPRKHRQPAEKAFLALETSGRLPPVVDGVDLLIVGLEADRKTWNPGFDPMPSTWLNQERYRTALLDLGWSFKARPGGGGVMPGWRWARDLGTSPAPVAPTTPTRPAWAVDYTAARSRGDIGGRLRGLLMDAYPGWPIRHVADPELSRVEAIWSKFEGSRDIDEILSLRPAIEAEIAKLEVRDGATDGRRGAEDGGGICASSREDFPEFGNRTKPTTQPSLWRDAPS